VGDLALLRREGDGKWVGDYGCVCGLSYRAAASEHGVRLWPASGSGFSPRFVDPGTPCFRCDRPLTLAVSVDVDPEKPRVPGSFASTPLREVRYGHGWTLLRLQGEFDLFNAPLLAALLECECRRRPERLIVDLSAVEFIDSTALHALLSARKLLPDWRGLIVVATTPTVQRTLAVSGADRLLSVRESLEELEAQIGE
jgi:anti-anti-sigma factor